MFLHLITFFMDFHEFLEMDKLAPGCENFWRNTSESISRRWRRKAEYARVADQAIDY